MTVRFERLSKITEPDFDGNTETTVDIIMFVGSDPNSEFAYKVELDEEGQPTEKAKEKLRPYRAEFKAFTAEPEQEDLDELELEKETIEELAKFGIKSVGQLATLTGDLSQKLGNVGEQARAVKSFSKRASIIKKRDDKIKELKAQVKELTAKLADFEKKAKK